MANKFTYNTSRWWFTVIEVLIAVTIFWITLIAFTNFWSFVQNETRKLTFKSDVLSELSLVDTQITNIIRSSYGINYTKTNPNTLVLYTDKLESSEIIIRVLTDTSKDTSFLIIESWWKTETLHTSNLYIQSVLFSTAPNPYSSPWTIDHQPWVSFEIKARHRSLLETENSTNQEINDTSRRIKSTVVIRNFIPSSSRN